MVFLGLGFAVEIGLGNHGIQGLRSAGLEEVLTDVVEGLMVWVPPGLPFFTVITTSLLS